MISDERLERLAETGLRPSRDDTQSMAKELLALRKGAKCQHQFNALKLVECGGTYLCCSKCGTKKVLQ